MNGFVKGLYSEYLLEADEKRKTGAEAYLRNQFHFIGLDTQSRRKIFKKFISKNKVPPYQQLGTIIKCMWLLEREMQYSAIELAALYKKEWQVSFIKSIELCIVSSSWWDTVDATASLLTAPYFKKFPSQIRSITSGWNKSSNIWLQRSSLLFQLKYKSETNTSLLAEYICNLSDSPEFFVQKAIGWILREYAKTDEEWVLDFVRSNPLKPLSRREALKNITLV